MDYAVIMTIHNNPLQVKRLCQTLENEHCHFLIHIDKKAKGIEEIKDTLKDIKNIHLYSEYKVYWGDITQVLATIFLLKEAIKLNLEYIFFISGQDYFIQSDNNLLKYVDIHNNYLEYQHLPYYEWGKEGRSERYYYYHNLINSLSFLKFNPRNRYYKKIDNTLVRIQRKIKIKRSFISDHEPYSGSNWLNINRECAQYIVTNSKKYLPYFKHVKFPDEMFIQTMLLNSPLKDTIIKDNLRYIDWVTGPEAPRILTTEDYDKIITSKCLFARKFDLKKDKDILDLIDQHWRRNYD